MGKKIFVSYKYADDNVRQLDEKTTVRTYVDKLEEYFERTDDIFKGESDNEDLSGLSEDAIWETLKDRMFDSSVTIVMISPNMKEYYQRERDQWIPWEISYSLKETERKEKTSRSNAVFAVVLPDKLGSYEYFIEDNQCGECTCITLKINTLFKILNSNMFNKKDKKRKNCNQGCIVYSGECSYILSVKWDDFTQNLQDYIDRANKIKENIKSYDIVKELSDE